MIGRREFLKSLPVALAAAGPATAALGGGRGRDGEPSAPIRPPAGRDLWSGDTRACPQVMGTDPWPCLRTVRILPDTSRLPGDPAALFATAAARPWLVIIHGNRYEATVALDEASRTAHILAGRGALPPDAVVVSFDWPSEQLYRNPARDAIEKGRRAMIAGYHLARFLAPLPAGARVCLLGHSHGSKAIVAALHLMAGGRVNSLDRDPPVALPALPPPLRLRAVLMASASDHDWFNPCERLERALWPCEAVLNLYNRRDLPLLPYPLTIRSDGARALGRVGLLPSDRARLGLLSCRVEQHDLAGLLGRSHSFLEAVQEPPITAWIAPYSTFPPPPISPR